MKITTSICTYKPKLEELAKTILSLNAAIDKAKSKYDLEHGLTIVDNSTSDWEIDIYLKKFIDIDNFDLIKNDKNVGFGKAHNQVIKRVKSSFHLILNPDVIVEEDAIYFAIEAFINNPEIVAITPEVSGPDGELQYLCKEYPSLFTLLLRGFAPNKIKKIFTGYLERYLIKDLVKNHSEASVKLISGCFIFAKTESLKKIGGFDEKYFLYFEDFDLSMRLRNQGHLLYAPNVRIVHYGGNTAKKGIFHIRCFTRSAFRFFNTYGWKLF